MHQEILLNVFLQSNSLDALCEAVGTVFGCPVLVTDNAFHIRCAFAPRDCLNADYRRSVARGELPLSVCRTISLCATDPCSRVAVGEGTQRFFVSTLRCAEIALGFVLYLTPDADSLPAAADCLFAEQLLAKQLYAVQGKGNTVYDTAQELLQELLAGAFPDAERFRRRTAGTFLANFSPEGFVLIAFTEQSQAGGDPSHFLQSLAREFPASHPFFHEGKIVLFVQHDTDLRRLRGAAERYRLQIVLYHGMRELFELEKSFRLARDVHRLVAASRPEAFFVDCADYAVWAELEALEECYGYLNPAIRALWKSDSQTGGSLCLTLYVYLCCHHSLQDAAAALFTHRNTVQYRLRRIREEFGIHTDAPGRCMEDLLSLSLALLRLGQAQTIQDLPRDQAESVKQ